MSLRVGDRVRVKTQAEILATLDDQGALDGMPFMPQMIEACGKEFTVSKRAHKLCDWGAPRRLESAVFLDELRCDGAAYGGCEMDCLIVWKDAWLERVDGRTADRAVERRGSNAPLAALVERVQRGSRANEDPENPGPRYRCQSTQIPAATTPQSVWDFRQYVEDVASGNARLGEVATVLFFLFFEAAANSGLGFGTFLRWSYDMFQKLRGGAPYPLRRGQVPKNSPTPSARLGLDSGEFVKIKTYKEVLDTLSEDLVNRGMNFAPDMVPYCGQTVKVSKRLRRIMNERTGKLIELKNDCLVLEGVTCGGKFTKPFLCPRGMSPYWREIWLERAEPSS
jgi:hypothetical protein